MFIIFYRDVQVSLGPKISIVGYKYTISLYYI